MNGLTKIQFTLHNTDGQQDDQTLLINRITGKTGIPGMSRWALYRHRVKSRRALLELTDAQLRDIGLDFHLARTEAMKPFWRE